MVIAINKLFAQLLFWLYELLDTIFEMFAVLCGIEALETADADVPRSLIEIFLESSAVTRAFLLIVIVSVVVAAVSTIVAIVKNIINMKGGERKSHAKTVGQGFGSIIVTLCMALVMIVGISMSNIVLQKVYVATSPDDNVTPACILFDMCVGKDYVIDWENPEPNMVPKIDPVTGLPMIDLTGEPILEPEVDYEGNVVYTYPRKKDPETGEDLYDTGWRGDNTIKDISEIGWSNLSPDQVFGVHKKVLGLFEDADKSYTTDPMVEMETFNFFLAYLVVVIMLVAIIWSMLGLVKRVYDLVLLFMALPLISATIPLDDGARFKQWRDSVVSKVILAYGVVLSINIFLLITPIINSISFEGLGWSAFVENLFKAFMLIGGALAINGGQLLLRGCLEAVQRRAVKWRTLHALCLVERWLPVVFCEAQKISRSAVTINTEDLHRERSLSLHAPPTPWEIKSEVRRMPAANLVLLCDISVARVCRALCADPQVVEQHLAEVEQLLINVPPVMPEA